MKTCCEDMKSYLSIEDKIIQYSEIFDEYSLVIHDGGSSGIVIKHCPWCGIELPISKRNLWFNTLKELGYNDPWNQELPIIFKNNEWRKK